MKQPARVWLALLAVYLFWGSTYLAIRYAVESLPPFLMAGTRQAVAGIVLFGLMRLRGAPFPKLAQWRTAAVVGIFLLLGGNGLVVWAEQRVISSVAALILGSTPLWIVLLDSVRPGGSRPNWQTAAGVLLGFAGIVFLINPSELGQPDSWLDLGGVVALLMAALLWATGSIYAREHKDQLPQQPLLGTSMEMLSGGAALLLVGSLAGEWSRLDVSAITRESLLSLVYLIVFGSLVAFSAYTWLLGVAPISLVSTYAYVNPLVAIALGVVIAQEPVTLRMALAAAVIIGAVMVIQRDQSQPARRRLGPSRASSD